MPVFTVFIMIRCSQYRGARKVRVDCIPEKEYMLAIKSQATNWGAVFFWKIQKRIFAFFFFW